MDMYNDGEEGEAGFLLCVKIPDLHSKTRIVVKQSDGIFSAKQLVLSKLQVSPVIEVTDIIMQLKLS